MKPQKLPKYPLNLKDDISCKSYKGIISRNYVVEVPLGGLRNASQVIVISNTATTRSILRLSFDNVIINSRPYRF